MENVQEGLIWGYIQKHDFISVRALNNSIAFNFSSCIKLNLDITQKALLEGRKGYAVLVKIESIAFQARIHYRMNYLRFLHSIFRTFYRSTF
jgi:hypothetical protein